MPDNVIRAFTEYQVERLTGISQRQLAYWARTDFYKPGLADEGGRVPFGRIYTFRDVAALRVLHVLRNQYNVSLQHLRNVAQTLIGLPDKKWTSTELFVLKRRVVFAEPGTQTYREIISGQYVMGIALAVVVEQTERDVMNFHERPDDQIGRIERNRNISHNAPVIAGTRIPVTAIKRFANAGYSVQQILQEYPTLKDADIRAALAYENDGLAA